MLKMLLDPMGGIVMTNDGYSLFHLEMPSLEKLTFSILPPRVSSSWPVSRMRRWVTEQHLSSL